MQLPEIKGKVGIFFTGGVESYYVGKICLEKYGKDSVIFMLFTQDSYNSFYKDSDKLKKVINDFNKSVDRIDGLHKHIMTTKDYNSSKGEWFIERAFYSTKKVFKDLEYITAGYNKIHVEAWNLVDSISFTPEMNEKEAYRKSRLELACYPKKYPELIDFMFKCNGNCYFYEEDFTVKKFDELIENSFDKWFFPLLYLKKEEVIKLYEKRNWLDELYLTNSCNNPKTDIHCGKCKNCLSRKLSFKNANIEDRTEYEL